MEKIQKVQQVQQMEQTERMMPMKGTESGQDMQQEAILTKE